MLMPRHVVPSVEYFFDELVVAKVWVSLANPIQERIPVEQIGRILGLDYDTILLLPSWRVWLLAFGFRSTH